jgi:hypothetical protein
MKWDERNTVQKVLYVIELFSGLAFWAWFLLHTFDILELTAVAYFLLLVNSVCRIFTTSGKVFRIIWIVIVVTMFLLAVKLYVLP